MRSLSTVILAALALVIGQEHILANPPCFAEIVRAPKPSASDAFGKELMRSPDGQWLYVQASGRPGILGKFYGAVDVFEIEADGQLSWRSEILPLNPDHNSDFGDQIVPLGDQVIISAPSEDFNGVWDAGQIYFFEQDGEGEWSGSPLVLSGESHTRLIGNEMAGAGDILVFCQNPDGADDRRHVHVYERRSGDWQFVTKLYEPDCEGNECASSFGNRLAVGSDFIVVGAAEDLERPGFEAGVVYIFERDAFGEWAATQVLAPSHVEEGAKFGSGIEIIDDSTMIIVASYSNHVAPGRVYTFERGEMGQWHETNEVIIETDGTKISSFGFRLDVSADKQLIAINAPLDNLPDVSERGLVYIIDRATDSQRILRPWDRFSNNTLVGVQFLTNTVLACGEPLAHAPGLLRAGRVWRLNLETFRNCHQDLDVNGEVGASDVAAILSTWGSSDSFHDLDCNGIVDFSDLVLVLSAWGACPLPPGI